MIGGHYYDYIAWKGVDLEQQGTDHSLDFARLMHVATFFAERVKLVEEQDAVARMCELKDSLQSTGCLSQETGDQRLVADNKEWNGHLKCECICQGCLPISRWTSEEYSVSWLQAV
jgi:hypothetical protein